MSCPKLLSRALLLTVALGVAGCATVSTEPANLSPLKAKIRTYVSTGEYQRGLADVAAKAEAWIKERAGKATPNEKLAMVFDLDETLLSNWPQLDSQDFGYVPAEWNAWVDSAKAEAIAPVKDVYLTARKLGLNVIFITGRGERDREGTLKNLKAIGCAEFAGIYFKPASFKTTGAFKTATRQKLEAEGWKIVANIGDQQSDLTGGYSERTFKLPDPFYLIE